MNSDGWRKYRIREIALEMGDAPFGALLKTCDYTDGGALVVQGKNLDGRLCDWSDRRYVSVKKHEELRRSWCYPGDMIFPKVGTIGKVGILTSAPGCDRYVLSTNTMRLRPDPKVADPDFVYYFFSSDPIRRKILLQNSNSVQPVFNFTSLQNFEIVLPPIEFQVRSGGVLRAFDDKITVNRSLSATLEAMACAIFRSWFIDFDPIRAKMEGRKPEGMDEETARLFPSSFELHDELQSPCGWRISSLPDAIAVNPSRSLKNISSAPYLDMKNMPTAGHRALLSQEREVGSGMKFQNGDTLVARITPCLENGKTAFVDFLRDGQVGWGSTEYIVLRSKEPLPSIYSYLLARSEDFRAFLIQNMTGTSGRQRVPAESLSQYKIVVPTSEVCRAFSDRVDPLFSKIKVLDEESRTLASLRDTLLPRLINPPSSLSAEPLQEATA